LISDLLILLRRLRISLLLSRLLSAFVAAPKPAGKSTHRGAGSRAFSGVACYCTANSTKCRASSSTSQNVTIRGAVLLVPGGAWRDRLRLARIKSGLANCP
jgi:hypothetical protein